MVKRNEFTKMAITEIELKDYPGFKFSIKKISSTFGAEVIGWADLDLEDDKEAALQFPEFCRKLFDVAVVSPKIVFEQDDEIAEDAEDILCFSDLSIMDARELMEKILQFSGMFGLVEDEGKELKETFEGELFRSKT